MHRLKRFLSLTLAILLLGGLAGVIIYAGIAFLAYISAVPKELGAALIAGATTILVATTTVMVGRYFERKKELDALYREKKTEVYDEFLKVFFQVWFSGGKPSGSKQEPDLVKLFQDFSVKLVLWSGPEALEAFARWREKMTEGHATAEGIFETEAFLAAIRADLRHSNRGLRKGWFARLFLKESSLFLKMAATNPKVSLADLASAEKLAQESKGKR
jgi:hypothetical protein